MWSIEDVVNKPPCTANCCIQFINICNLCMFDYQLPKLKYANLGMSEKARGPPEALRALTPKSPGPQGLHNMGQFLYPSQI